MVIAQAILLAVVAVVAAVAIVLWAVAFYQAVSDILDDRERERRKRAERGRHDA